MIEFLKILYRPNCYHGFPKRNNFFEGWFFKCVDKEKQNILAIIPGIYKSKDKTKEHAFIQFLNAETHQSSYIKYSFNEFTADKKKFLISIGDSIFSEEYIVINIDTPGLRVSGELKFSGLKTWPVKLTSPGIMGWYSFVPFMECNHGIVSLDHDISGALNYNGKLIDFEGGKGYSEKDWGSSFPEAYIWTQSNHFAAPGVSFTASVAKIPWLFSSFRGFIAGLLVKGDLYKFATYTGATLNNVMITDTYIEFSITDKKHRLNVRADRKDSGKLHAPYGNEMTQRVAESLNSEIHIKLMNRQNNKVVFEGTGYCAGLDVNGKLEQIVG